MSTYREIKFTVYGRPQPRGSKRPIPFMRKHGDPTGRTMGVRTIDSNPKSEDWMNQVKVEAVAAMRRAGITGLLSGPIYMKITFYLKRPKCHYRSGKNSHLLRDDAPDLHTTKPDSSKMKRGIDDALSGLVYRDDCDLQANFDQKFFGEPERAEITVRELNPITRTKE